MLRLAGQGPLQCTAVRIGTSYHKSGRGLHCCIPFTSNNFASREPFKCFQRLTPLLSGSRCGIQHQAKWFHAGQTPPADSVFYTKSHEYLRYNSSTGGAHVARIGVSEYAAEELGEVVFVEALVEEGEAGVFVQEGDPVCAVEAVKSVAEIYAPISGKVLRFNPKLKDNPGTINLDPEGEGWIFEIEVVSEEGSDHPGNTKKLTDEISSNLLDWKAYASYVVSERNRLGS